MNQAEQGEQSVPGTAPLVHRVRVQRRVFQQPGVQGPHAVALGIEGASERVVAGRDHPAVLGIQQEH